MGNLDRRHGAVRFDKFRHARQWRNVQVLPEPHIAWGDAAARFDCRRFDVHQPGPALGAAPQVNHMPIGRVTVLRGVLAHGRYADAVAQRHPAQGQWLENFSHREEPRKDRKDSEPKVWWRGLIGPHRAAAWNVNAWSLSAPA